MPLPLLSPVATNRYPFCIQRKLEHNFLSSNQSVPLTTHQFFFPAFPQLKYYLELKNIKTNETGKTKLKIALIFDSKYQKFRVSADFVLTINECKIVQRSFKFENYGLHECVIDDDNFYNFGEVVVINLHGCLFFERTPWNSIALRVDRNTRNDFTKHETKNFAICVENKKLMIHKYILHQHSSIILTSKISSIVIHGFDYKIVKMIVNLYYGINPKKPLTAEEYIQILYFACEFGMEQIKSVVKKSIVLTPANICEFTNFAAQQNWNEFFDECLEYLTICMKHSYPITDFETLDNDVMYLFRKRMMASEVENKSMIKSAFLKVKELLDCCLCF